MEMAYEQKHYDMLVEHLPYEIDMLRISYAFLRSTERLKLRESLTEKTEIVTFLSNAAIEAFWIHTSCLLEFFRRVSHAEGRTACAQDFTNERQPYDLPFDSLEDSINDQICHLHYKRFRDSSNKIDGFTMQRVKEAIERAIVLFESNLKDDFARIWTARPDVKMIDVASADLSATNVIFSISTTESTSSLTANFITGPTNPYR
jgi:hypothetical protein